MKTYTFFYFDSDDNLKRNNAKRYTIQSLCFDSAFKSFVSFYCYHLSDYVSYSTTYYVYSNFTTRSRCLTHANIEYFEKIKRRFSND